MLYIYIYLLCKELYERSFKIQREEFVPYWQVHYIDFFIKGLINILEMTAK